MKFEKSVALITGGAMGLGQMFSKKLMERGTRVIVADINPKAGEKFINKSREKHGDDAITFMQCNVTDSEQLKDTFQGKERTSQNLKPITYLGRYFADLLPLDNAPQKFDF